ncbi:beta-N-acetylglucosaminidase domain-containing protein [Streptomyces sp. NPDC046977]|uniref:beta-N-acetylglucosaminidase domain-containing protein n=1 Tax=Streptomyces sp. NPDC046977 TaxID=3154703 RepID=UPI0033C5BF61
MTRGRRTAAARTAAIVAAVVGGVLGVSPGAVAAPPATPSPPTALPDAPAATARTAALPAVHPRPQVMRERGGLTTVPDTVTLLAGPGADPYALDVLRGILRDAGVRDLRDSTDVPRGGLTVYADGEGAETALRALGAAPVGDLPPGGYRLAVGHVLGHGTVALAGTGEDGLFHAAQTLRQLMTPQGLPGVVVRDWPVAAARGMAESFYGEPWTAEQRLSQVDFLGRTKQNRYLYAPGDDPYRQELWRDPYPAARRADFRALAERAQANHVTLIWAVAPGQALCFSSQEDRKALLRKIDAMWALGVRGFQLQFQDVSYSEWHCRADAALYGDGPWAAARAQAEVADAVARHLERRRGEGGIPLSLLPTEYYQDGATDFRDELARTLDGTVQVAWTGVGVVPGTITGAQVAGAQDALRHPLLTMDNYPVNDWADDRIFLGPYTGREPAVAAVTAGVLATAMRQPAASRIALFTAADYAWNPHAYDRASSWKAAVDDLAGTDPATRDALRALAGNEASSALDDNESAYLRPLLKEFLDAYGNGSAQRLAKAAGRLRAAFTTMSGAPQRLDTLADGSFGGEVQPWLDQLARYGAAGEHAVDILVSLRAGDGTGAWKDRLALESARRHIARSAATVGDGVLDPFLAKTLATADAWTGMRAEDGTATATLGSARATEPSLMTDGKDSTAWASDAPPQEGDTFGVDLGGTHEIREVRIAMGSAQPGPEQDDYLGRAVLEYSAGDAAGWRPVTEVAGERTVTATLPEGTRARYVRLRATAAQENAVTVREFTVTTRDGHEPAVPAGDPAAGAAADGDATTAYRVPADGLTLEYGAARPLEALTVLTGPEGGTGGTVEARLPGQGWRRLGALGSGWTELPAHGLRVDAVRVTPAPGTPPPVVHEIVPWYADRPAARMTLDRTEADVEAGGAPATVTAELTDASPGAARVTLTAKAPPGIRATAPGGIELPRGGRVVVPVRLSLPEDGVPGVYEVPLEFRAEGRTVRQTVTVHAYPRTGGPDVAQGGTATSSGDETPDFPASALTDGDPATRWSSPAQDDAWVQVELGRAAWIGRVTLRWQDAYASRYTILTSADGQNWHTAAVVDDGRGGTESVRLDAPGDTRFLRVQGVERGTKFGYSLYSLQAFAVTG